ncbi:hypothetical protein AVEN_39394-1 [Araneus ventricosus]|uniref:Uncharacterized protein n=1 Tax=Araneus ventricosus TaxID=182803 RepID=A0A4Y2S4Z4_ARAVE|nr:hypothetical protein AVEN_39394-1 [Araneus ventricosus]
MSLDYLRDNNEAASLNLVLHDINATLEQHGLSCALIGIPVPTANAIEIPPYNQDVGREDAEQRISSLNREQLIIHHCSLSNCIFLGKPMKNKKNLQLQPQNINGKKIKAEARKDKTPEPTGPGGPQLEQHQPLAYPITKEFKK